MWTRPNLCENGTFYVNITWVLWDLMWWRFLATLDRTTMVNNSIQIIYSLMGKLGKSFWVPLNSCKLGKRSAGNAPQLNLRNLLPVDDETCKKEIHYGFETQGRHHQRSKIGISVAHQKGLMSSKIILKKILPQLRTKLFGTEYLLLN